MRPRDFSDFFGQSDIVSEGKLLRNLIEKDEIPSIIFWGPPGVGKTTLAKIIAGKTQSKFIELSATSSGLADLRAIMEKIKNPPPKSLFDAKTNGKTALFVDEIHRWNKSQQDALLPYVEKGMITLIGATTENPSFEINSALLSRSRVFVLKYLDEKEICEILKCALSDKERGLGNFSIEIADETLEFLSGASGGDARTALNALELAVKNATTGAGHQSVCPPCAAKPKDGCLAPQSKFKIEIKDVKESLQKSHLFYDKNGEQHFNIISALHKSLRGSDADASLYWLGRMLEAGEDPLYVARRLIRFASEDVGLADPKALLLAVAAYQTAHFLGMPECNLALAHATAYLAKAPKSNKVYIAYSQVQKDIQELPNEPVPLHLRNAPTDLMKNLGYGKDYKYNPDFQEPVAQDYLPEKLKGRKYLK